MYKQLKSLLINTMITNKTIVIVSLFFIILIWAIAQASKIKVILSENSKQTINQQTKLLKQYGQIYQNILQKNCDINNQLSGALKHYQQQTVELDKNMFVINSGFNRLRDSIKDIQSTTNAISQYFDKPDTKGNFGEFTLEDVLNKSGLIKNKDFFTQRMFGRQQPDASVIINGKFYHIDAKTSLPKQTQSTLDWLKTLKDKYQKQIQTLAKSDYGSIPQSMPIVILFIPSDALLINLINADHRILSFAHDNKIILSSPTTLNYIINTLKYVTSLNTLESSAMIHDKPIDLSDVY